MIILPAVIFHVAKTTQLDQPAIQAPTKDKPQNQVQDDQFKPTPPILPPLIQNPKLVPPDLSSGSKQLTVAHLSPDLAVNLAIHLQPSLKVAEAAATEARGLLIQARAGLLPSETITGGYTYQTRFGQLGLGPIGSGSGSSGSSGTLSGFSTQVQVKQLLFDFGHTVDLVNQASHTAKAAENLATKAKLDLAFAVRSQYFQTIQADQQVTVNQADVSAQQTALDLATGLLKQGQGAPSDVVTAEANLNNSTLALAQAQATALDDRVALAGLVGINPLTPLTLDETFPAAPALPELTVAVQSAMATRPDLLAAQESVEAAQSGLKAQKLGLAPQVDLTLEVGSRGSTDPFATDTTSAGVAVTIPIGDGGTTQGKVEQAQGVLDAAQASLKSTQLLVIQDVAQAYVSVQSAIQKQAVATAGVANSLESLKIAQGSYKAGAGLLLTVDTASANYLTAQSSLLAANSELATAYAQYLQAVGKM